MDLQPRDHEEENKLLQRFVNDLVSVVALPAMWSGSEPSRIAHALLDALLRMLELDLIYIRLKGKDGERPVGAVRFAQSQIQIVDSLEMGKLLEAWLGADPQEWPLLSRKTLGNRDISLVPLGLGLQGEIGVMVAGSEREDFPRRTERILLSVAVNQASIALQEARRLDEQKRVASELDRRVAQRTTELAAANDELRNEIAERRQIEKRLLESEALLKESEARLWEVINTIPVIAWFCPPNGANEFLNKRWTEYTGLSPAESTGSGWRVAYHPDDLPRLIEHRQKYMSSGEPGEIQARIRSFDGVYRWFLIRAEPFRDESRKIVRWYGTCTDVHDRRRAEEDLGSSEEKHRVILEAANDAVVSMDDHGVILLVNPATKQMFGYDPVEIIGKPMTILMPETMRKLHDTGYKRYLATGQRHLNWHGVEVTALRKDGREFPVEVSFGEMTSDGRKIFTGFIRDISERKQAEDKLRASEEALRNTQDQLSRATRTATVGEFAAAMAHEINQPLAAVVTNGEACLNWLAAEPPGLAKAQEAAARIVRDGKEAGEVVRRIRALFKRAPTEKIELDLNEVISEVLQLMTGETRKRRVVVETDLADDLPLVMGDRVQLQQLVFNLLLNGIEAMDSIVEREKKLFIRTVMKSPETFLVEIRDSGVGLEDPEKVFEAFFTTKESGMGMGLAVSRSIVVSHHGRLWAESNGGEGTTFSFTLPIQTRVAS